MVTDPDRYLEEFAEAGSDILSVHLEACQHLHRTLQNIRELEVHVGIAVNPATSLSGLEEVLDEVDLILLMSVNPGFGGQRFIPAMLPKIRRLKETLEARRLKPEIEVDGGVNIQNSNGIVQAGADIIVAGTAVFRSENYQKTIACLKGQRSMKILPKS
jgi:ribulose-phosphate 3-epimerase